MKQISLHRYQIKRWIRCNKYEFNFSLQTMHKKIARKHGMSNLLIHFKYITRWNTNNLLIVYDQKAMILILKLFILCKFYNRYDRSIIGIFSFVIALLKFNSNKIWHHFMEFFAFFLLQSSLLWIKLQGYHKKRVYYAINNYWVQMT